MSELYSHATADRLIGCLFQNPSLVLEQKYKLNKDEFTPCKFHQILYICIYNMVCNDYKSISIFDINSFLSPYEAQYQVYLDNNGDSYISTIIELTDEENFDGYYNEFKKLSCLRKYKEHNYPIDKFWDFEKTDEKNLENVNQYSIEDIINHFEGIQVDIKKDYCAYNSDVEETQAGVGLDELKEKLQAEPLYGHSFCSELMNSITRGLMDGQLTCMSSPSGVGKTTCAVASMCKICATKLWDYEENNFIDNPTKQKWWIIYSV